VTPTHPDNTHPNPVADPLEGPDTTTVTPPDPVQQALTARDTVRVLLVAAWSPTCVLLGHAGLDTTADVIIDIDADPDAAERYQVWSLPTLLFVAADGVRRRIVGAACIDELHRPN
jgi:hypothetical protein